MSSTAEHENDSLADKVKDFFSGDSEDQDTSTHDEPTADSSHAYGDTTSPVAGGSYTADSSPLTAEDDALAGEEAWGTSTPGVAESSTEFAPEDVSPDDDYTRSTSLDSDTSLGTDRTDADSTPYLATDEGRDERFVT